MKIKLDEHLKLFWVTLVIQFKVEEINHIDIWQECPDVANDAQAIAATFEKAKLKHGKDCELLHSSCATLTPKIFVKTKSLTRVK